MRKILILFLAVTVMTVLAACSLKITLTPITEPPTSPTGTATEAPPVTGWQLVNGKWYCYNSEGKPLRGWITDKGNRYYLNDAGMALTGWQDLEGKRYYFDEKGVMTTGWLHLEDGSYYFGIDGSLFTGLLNIGGKGYYFGQDGRRYSGWKEISGKTYYFDGEGIMAVGQVEIDGKRHHFNPHGVKVLLVNPWNYIPEGYTVELEYVTNEYRLETECAAALRKMLEDCAAAGYSAKVASAYRTHDDQVYLFNRKVKYYMEMDMSKEKAQKEAGKSVAVPDTSEHQLGLAVDIVDIDYGILDEKQATMPAQKWLMEHCHEYGFILRYPVGATAITGIIYEPWHYRYVGEEIAQEITNLGITLEEYLGVS